MRTIRPMMDIWDEKSQNGLRPSFNCVAQMTATVFDLRAPADRIVAYKDSILYLASEPSLSGVAFEKVSDISVELSNAPEVELSKVPAVVV
uniref:Uncharacterized protein n=1 Tax=Pristionchus pacificus TaxID=54126 RepID=A0A2A6B695_PRIPA|eukprot:PDM61394.1 hypothetical protein PRIPAC_50836 [Pristionchus pacificus]